MGDSGLRPEERKLKSLISSLDLVDPDGLNQAADDVRLIRQYGGTIDLKQRLIDLELVGPRQLDAIERGLGMGAREEKAHAAAREPAEGVRGSEISAPEGKAYIDMSRLSSSLPGTAGGQDLANIHLGAAPASEHGDTEGFHQRPIPGAKEDAPEQDDKSPGRKHVKGGFVPSWKKGRPQAETEDEDKEEVVEREPRKSGGPPTIAEQEERIQHIIRHIVHTRQHEQIIDFLIRRKMNIVEPAEVAKALSLGQRQVRDVLDDLKVSHVIKDIGTHPYALSPGPRELRDLKFFLQMWKRRDWHSKMLAWILDQEKKRGG